MSIKHAAELRDYCSGQHQKQQCCPTTANLQASQALAALAQAEQASASALVETCLENLSISAMQLGAPGSTPPGQVSQPLLLQRIVCMCVQATLACTACCVRLLSPKLV